MSVCQVAKQQSYQMIHRHLLLLVALVALQQAGQPNSTPVAKAFGEPFRPKFELKFQNELDNSTIGKLAGQQQVFKCQVRLAPVNQLQAGRLSSRLKTIYQREEDPVQEHQQAVSAADETGRPNATLAIEWLKDELPIGSPSSHSLIGSAADGGALLEPISVINVTLKSSFQGQRFDKRNKSRIEIKNTLNSNQLKLTSRLRLNQLRPTDSGRYKCLARASFKQSTQSNNEDQSTGRAGVFQVDQWLESSGPILTISNETISSNGECCCWLNH